MLTYHLDQESSVSLYDQLYTFIRRDIESGLLVPGERLPSKRVLAGNLGVSSITVENAYHQLMDEGYIQALPKKGYFISESLEIAPVRQTAGRKEIHLPLGEPACLWNLTNNQTSPENFPFSIWSRLLREIMRDRKEELMVPAPSGGTRKILL